MAKQRPHQRICIFAGKETDPNSDRHKIQDMLRNKFNIHLPQRTDPLSPQAMDTLRNL